MTLGIPPHITLENLAHGIPVIPEEAVGFYKHNCIVCFHSQGHSAGVEIEVQYRDTSETFVVLWEGEVTEQILRAYRDERKTTDFGACAVSLLLVRELTEYTAIEQSNVGTTIDYYLVKKEQAQQDDTLIFNGITAYLEVSGIRCETLDNTVADRFKEKQRRLNPPEELPTIISVVEFSRPWTKMAEV